MCFVCGGIRYGEAEGLVSVERWSCSRCVYNVQRERVLVADSLVSHEPTCVLLYLGLEVVRGHGHTTTFTPHLTHQPSIRCRGRGEYLRMYVRTWYPPPTHPCTPTHTTHTHCNSSQAANTLQTYVRIFDTRANIHMHRHTYEHVHSATPPPPPHTYSSLYLWPVLL